MNRQKYVRKILPLIAVIFLAVLAIWAGTTSPVFAYADWYEPYDPSYDPYRYEITGYTVDMDVHTDSTVDVKEVIRVNLLGGLSHGIIRDLPLDHGIKYRDFEAACDNSDFEYYQESDDSEFLSIYLRGEQVATGQSRTYTLTYTMVIPVSGEYLPLDVIGYGWQARIENVKVTVNCPVEVKNYNLYSGYEGTTKNEAGVVSALSADKKTVTLTAEYLPRYGVTAMGITLDLQFPEGTLSKAFDMSILWAILIGVGLVVIAILLKLFVFKQPLLTETVNFTAPEEMDPLKMGKYIDNSLDSEDMGAMVFWYADQGYLTIDMTEDEDDPILTRTEKEMPDDAPVYQKVMLDGLFRRRAGAGESIQISDLKNKFYSTAQEVPKLLKIQKLYRNFSKCFAVLAAIACGLLLGGVSFVYSLGIVSTYTYMLDFLFLLIGSGLAAVASNVATQRSKKWKKISVYLFMAGGIAVGFLAELIGALCVPHAGIGLTPRLLLGLFAALTGSVAGSCLVRTKEYNEILGQILGFKNFILYTEKDKIEIMLEESPELYYHILPYAQVLGVTNEWTDKFKDLTLEPPTYARYSTSDVVFSAILWNSMFSRVRTSMRQVIIANPSSSGSRGIGGGFGGGFGGGGFGGGGGRGC